MVENNVEYGLGVLRYLGIGELIDKEKEWFKEKWPGVYDQRREDVVWTTWTLYSEVLPFLESGADDDWKRFTQIERDDDFGKRIEDSNLKLRLGSGESIEDILGKYFRGA